MGRRPQSEDVLSRRGRGTVARSPEKFRENSFRSAFRCRALAGVQIGEKSREAAGNADSKGRERCEWLAWFLGRASANSLGQMTLPFRREDNGN